MQKTNDRRTWVARRFPPSKLVETPEQALRFATRRCEHLHAHATDRPLDYLLTCAYLQGVNDTAGAHINNPELIESALAARAELLAMLRDKPAPQKYL